MGSPTFNDDVKYFNGMYNPPSLQIVNYVEMMRARQTPIGWQGIRVHRVPVVLIRYRTGCNVTVTGAHCFAKDNFLVTKDAFITYNQLINMGKTEVMVSSRRGTTVNIKDSQVTSLRQVNKFKYLDVTISEEGGSEEAVRARVSAAWGKWRDLSGVISDKKISRKLKTKLYMTVIRPVLLHGAQCWTVRKKEQQILEKTEMRMLRRIKGVTLRDKVWTSERS